jgi:hypothetical protein
MSTDTFLQRSLVGITTTARAVSTIAGTSTIKNGPGLVYGVQSNVAITLKDGTKNLWDVAVNGAQIWTHPLAFSSCLCILGQASAGTAYVQYD